MSDQSCVATVTGAARSVAVVAAVAVRGLVGERVGRTAEQRLHFGGEPRC